MATRDMKLYAFDGMVVSTDGVSLFAQKATDDTKDVESGLPIVIDKKERRKVKNYLIKSQSPSSYQFYDVERLIDALSRFRGQWVAIGFLETEAVDGSEFVDCTSMIYMADRDAMAAIVPLNIEGVVHLCDAFHHAKNEALREACQDVGDMSEDYD